MSGKACSPSRRCSQAALGGTIAKTKLRRGKEAIDDHVIAAHAVVHELRGLAFGAWRHLALADAERKLDVDLFCRHRRRLAGARAD
jgi:hypothetical protein